MEGTFLLLCSVRVLLRVPAPTDGLAYGPGMFFHTRDLVLGSLWFDSFTVVITYRGRLGSNLTTGRLKLEEGL